MELSLYKIKIMIIIINVAYVIIDFRSYQLAAAYRQFTYWIL